ncbi:trehalose-phosphatase [Aeromicrobium sp. Sec7.5]|uniref:trehalose-phosphatase n=1 Tax=Aeromicrobium sp. Sec7.5 TaxID=3121276 RepID=UPI002FE441C1
MTSADDLLEIVANDPAGVLIALDFDGTLAPIVVDPTAAGVHPRSLAALDRLGPRLGGLAIITGRPVAQVRQLGDLDAHPGLRDLVVRGQYGAERWSPASGVVEGADRHEVVDRLVADLPALLEAWGAPGALVEDKGLAVAVHTRGLSADVATAVLDPLRDLARTLELTFEPGRQVYELRSASITKGDALLDVVAGLAVHTVVFAGDDLGDLPAYDAVDDLASRGVTTLKVCSASTEQDALVARSDLVLEGPDGVAEWLTTLADVVDPVG